MAKGILVHDVYSSSSASHWFKTPCFLPTEKTAACSARGPAQFICHPCAGWRGWSSTSRSSAAVSTEEKSLCLQPWVSDQVGAGARLQGKHVVDRSISMNSLSVRSASCAFTIKLFLPKPDGGHRYYGQQLRPWGVTVPCSSLPRDPAATVHILSH